MNVGENNKEALRDVSCLGIAMVEWIFIGLLQTLSTWAGVDGRRALLKRIYLLRRAILQNLVVSECANVIFS